jgi:hypothetical protein
VESLIGQLLDEHLVSRRITASATARQGVALEVTYDTRLKAGTAPDALVRALNQVEGVQGVELRRRATLED